jgi:hypothetical protein
MAVGSFNLTVVSSALFCFGTFVVSPSAAAPQRPWYLAAFDRVLRAVSDESHAASPRETEKLAEQIYTSRITKDGGTITLRGQVPSESDVKLLQGVAAATSPGAPVADKSRVDANVPDRDVWLAAMTFALRQLGKLEHGSALLRNTSITIDGVTKADDDFATVQKKLRDEAPKGLILQVSLKPHDARPFVWLAQLQPGTLTLSGHVPDQQDKVLCGYAQNLFQTLKVNNGMEFAKGEPQNWLTATKLALDMLALLYSGNAAVSDNVIKLEGIYSSPAMIDLLKSYSQRLPKGYKLETNILEPVARAPAARAEDVSLAHNAPASMSP